MNEGRRTWTLSYLKHIIKYFNSRQVILLILRKRGLTDRNINKQI